MPRLWGRKSFDIDDEISGCDHELLPSLPCNEISHTCVLSLWDFLFHTSLKTPSPVNISLLNYSSAFCTSSGHALTFFKGA